MISFTAIGDGLTDDTVALNSFIAASDHAVIPSGVFRTTGPLLFRSGQRIEFSGDASIIKPDGNVTDKVISLVGVSHTSISNFKIQAPANPNLKCVSLDGCWGVNVERFRVYGGGGFPVHLSNSTDCEIDRVRISGGYARTAIQAVDCRNTVIRRHKIYAANQGEFGVQIVRGTNNTVDDGYIEKTPDNYFGIHAWGSDYAKVTNNRVENTRREAIAVGHKCVGVEVTGNHCIWTENLGVGDFGMSVAGDDTSKIVADFLISGNTIVNSAFDGIGIAGFAQRGLITGNTIRDACRANAFSHNAGVKLYGWIPGGITEYMLVTSNIVTRISSPGLVSIVNEVAELGSVGNNTVSENKKFNLAGNVSLTAASSVSRNNG